MAQTAGASSNKAFFTNVDTNQTFHVQFNPKEFKLDEKASWKASDEHQTDKPLLTYEKGEPTTVSMDLIFDSTDNGGNVNEKFVMPLRDFLTADVSKTDSTGKTIRRPPYCKFTWGGFTFDCVVEKVSCTFLMFKQDGTPLRAKVQVGLKERERNVTGGSGDNVTLTALGSVFQGASTNATTTTVLEGDTINSVAHRVNASPQDIALANNIADPMNLKAGQKLVVPANTELARILARQSLRHTPAYWKTDRQQDPFKVPEARAGETRYVPSALDEDGPVALDYAVDPGGLANAYISFGSGGSGSSGDSAFIGVGKGAEYGDYGESDFTFGQRQRQEYGGYAASEAAAGPGGGAEYGEFGPSGAAGGFRNEATPDGQAGAAPQAQTYGGYGASEVASTSSDGAPSGGSAAATPAGSVAAGSVAAARDAGATPAGMSLTDALKAGKQAADETDGKDD